MKRNNNFTSKIFHFLPYKNGDKNWGWFRFTSNSLNITENEQIHSENLHFWYFWCWVSLLNIGPLRVKRVSPLDTSPPTPQQSAKLQMLLRDCRRVVRDPGRVSVIVMPIIAVWFGSERLELQSNSVQSVKLNIQQSQFQKWTVVVVGGIFMWTWFIAILNIVGSGRFESLKKVGKLWWQKMPKKTRFILVLIMWGKV